VVARFLEMGGSCWDERVEVAWRYGYLGEFGEEDETKDVSWLRDVDRGKCRCTVEEGDGLFEVLNWPMRCAMPIRCEDI
jgi:hypothetical protein